MTGAPARLSAVAAAAVCVCVCVCVCACVCACACANLERRLPFQYVCCTQVFLCKLLDRMCIGFERDGA